MENSPLMWGPRNNAALSAAPNKLSDFSAYSRALLQYIVLCSLPYLTPTVEAKEPVAQMQSSTDISVDNMRTHTPEITGDADLQPADDPPAPKRLPRDLKQPGVMQWDQTREAYFRDQWPAIRMRIQEIIASHFDAKNWYTRERGKEKVERMLLHGRTPLPHKEMERLLDGLSNNARMDLKYLFRVANANARIVPGTYRAAQILEEQHPGFGVIGNEVMPALMSTHLHVQRNPDDPYDDNILSSARFRALQQSGVRMSLHRHAYGKQDVYCLPKKPVQTGSLLGYQDAYQRSIDDYPRDRIVLSDHRDGEIISLKHWGPHYRQLNRSMDIVIGQRHGQRLDLQLGDEKEVDSLPGIVRNKRKRKMRRTLNMCNRISFEPSSKVSSSEERDDVIDLDVLIGNNPEVFKIDLNGPSATNYVAYYVQKKEPLCQEPKNRYAVYAQVAGTNEGCVTDSENIKAYQRFASSTYKAYDLNGKEISFEAILENVDNGVMTMHFVFHGTPVVFHVREFNSVETVQECIAYYQ